MVLGASSPSASHKLSKFFGEALDTKPRGKYLTYYLPNPELSTLGEAKVDRMNAVKLETTASNKTNVGPKRTPMTPFWRSTTPTKISCDLEREEIRPQQAFSTIDKYDDGKSTTFGVQQELNKDASPTKVKKILMHPTSSNDFIEKFPNQESASTSSLSVASSAALPSQIPLSPMLGPLEYPRAELQSFPCRRIDKCTWSLLDETLCKYQTTKKTMGRKKGWKSRRITLNSQLCNKDMGLIEPHVCLHGFKRSEPFAVEFERLIMNGSSIATVPESTKQYGRGIWLMKVSGNIINGEAYDNSKVSQGKEVGDHQRGEWLLSFDNVERLQVWLKLLRVSWVRNVQ